MRPPNGADTFILSDYAHITDVSFGGSFTMPQFEILFGMIRDVGLRVDGMASKMEDIHVVIVDVKNSANNTEKRLEKMEKEQDALKSTQAILRDDHRDIVRKISTAKKLWTAFIAFLVFVLTNAFGWWSFFFAAKPK